MTGRRPVTIALVVLVAAAVVAGAIALLGRGGGSPTPLAAPGPAGSLADVAPQVAAGPAAEPAPATRGVASPAASASTTAGTVTAATPAPYIQTFAAQPGVRPQPALPSPKTTKSVAAYVDGCDHAYGTRTQCVPLAFPAGTTDKCAWLAAHGFTRLVVVGVDRQRLDPDGNRIACDS